MVSIRRNKFTPDELKQRETLILRNLEVYKRNFFQILDSGLNKMIIVYVLPELLANDGKLLKSTLTHNELKTVLNLYKMTQTSLKRNKIVSAKSIRSLQSRSKNYKFRTKRSLLQLAQTKPKPPSNRTITYYNDIIFILHKNREVLKIARSLIYELPTDFLQIYCIWIALRNRCVEIFDMTALDEKNFETKIRHAWNNNLYIKETINALEDIYVEKFNERMKYKELKLKIIYEEYQLKNEINYKCNSEIMNIIMESEDRMKYQNSNLDQNKLTCVVNLSDLYNKYEKRHASNLKDEKSLRKQINKRQQKLNNIIQTFEDETSELQEIYDEIEVQYEQEKKKCEDLMIKNEELLCAYEKMEYEDHILRRIKIREIRKKLAILKIQRWWRKILRRRRRKLNKIINQQPTKKPKKKKKGD